MCPAMGWLDCGQRFYCPFCEKLTEGKIENGESEGEPKPPPPRILFTLILEQLDKIFKISAFFTCIFYVFCSSVPWQHYQPTNGVEGARVDKDKRPELSMGSYEILSSQKVRFT